MLVIQQVLEPHKCYGWQWATWEELQAWENMTGKANSQAPHDPINGATTLFLPLLNLFKQRPTFNPLEAWGPLGKLN